MCRSMVDIYSVTAAIRRGKKEKKPQGKNIRIVSIVIITAIVIKMLS